MLLMDSFEEQMYFGIGAGEEKEKTTNAPTTLQTICGRMFPSSFPSPFRSTHLSVL